MTFNWDDDKNEKLKKTRNISFEEIILAIKNGDVLDVLVNERYKMQVLIIVNYNNYAYVVPAAKNKNEYFLKTIFPSRKFTKQYLKEIKEP